MKVKINENVAKVAKHCGIDTMTLKQGFCKVAHGIAILEKCPEVKDTDEFEVLKKSFEYFDDKLKIQENL